MLPNTLQSINPFHFTGHIMALSESHKAVLLAELKANKVTNALKVYDSYCDCFFTLGPVSNSMVMQLEVVSRLLPFPLLLPSCRIDTSELNQFVIYSGQNSREMATGTGYISVLHNFQIFRELSWMIQLMPELKLSILLVWETKSSLHNCIEHAIGGEQEHWWQVSVNHVRHRGD